MINLQRQFKKHTSMKRNHQLTFFSVLILDKQKYLLTNYLLKNYIHKKGFALNNPQEMICY